jgi:sugar/nucleoside kinase (ribokinase family)
MIMDAVVFGNITLDVICHVVDDVPRYESISFEHVVVAPGGCGSNVAIGLCAHGVPTALIGRTGADDAANLVQSYWKRIGLDTRFVQEVEGVSTGTSVGLVDHEAQPRFIHTSGANRTLTSEAIDVPLLVKEGARNLHIGGYFVLPGVMDNRFGKVLAEGRQQGLVVSLDVVRSPRMADPSLLWTCLPNVDIFLCNSVEAYRLSGENEPRTAALALRSRGARAVIIKLGGEGCWLESLDYSELIPAPPAKVLDTTGAGDAFAAGLIAASIQNKDLLDACRAGNQAGARAVEVLGAVTIWFQ